MKYKTCSICKKELELTSENFYKDNKPLILITGESITYEEIEEEYGLLNATE